MLPYRPAPFTLRRRTPVLPKVVSGVLVGLCLFSACVTSRSSEPVGLDRAVLRPVPASRAWLVQDSGLVAGSVVRYAERGPDGRFLYMVRNLWDQDLGVIDEKGRAWKRIPHQDDRWIGTGTVVQGVRLILDLGEACTMSERALEDIEAATRAARGD